MKDLFKNKNYLLLFSGNLVSELGNVLFSFVSGLYVADLTGKESMLAIFMALGAGARVLFSPLAGVIADRFDKIKLIYLTDYFRGLMFVLVSYFFFVGVTKTEATWILLVVVAISGLVSAIFAPAVTAATPEIVGLDMLQQANGANSIINSVTAIAGILFGILAFSLFSFEVAVLINGISFILSGFSEMFIKALHKEEVPQEKHAVLQDIKVGFRYIKEKNGLMSMLTYLIFINFAIAPIFSVALPSLFRIQLARSAWEIGWIEIAFAGAMMISGIVVGSMKIKHLSKTIKMNLFLVVMSLLLMTVNIYLFQIGFYGYWLFYAFMILVNIMVATFMIALNVPFNTSIVKVIEPQMRGRVFSTVGAITSGLTPVAMVLGGYLIENTSVSFLGLICSLIMLVPTIGFITNRKIHTMLEDLERDAAEEDKSGEDAPSMVYAEEMV